MREVELEQRSIIVDRALASDQADTFTADLAKPRPTRDSVRLPRSSGGRAPTGDRASSRLTELGLITCLLLAGFNLRPALASVGALLDQIRAGLGMSGALAGILTAVPSAGFAAVGAAAPWLLRRVSPGRLIACSMALLSAGLASRAFATDSPLFLACSALAVAGIGIGNVAMPAVVRHHYPRQIARYTGLYSAALTAGAALSAATSVPAGHAFGSWRAGLAIWALPAAVAAVAWLAIRGPASRPAGRAGLQPPAVAYQLPSRSPAAWCLAMFFGLQAAGAYIVLGWLPQILEDAGVSSGTAGFVLALTPVVSVPFAVLIPLMMGRGAEPARLIVLLSLIGAAGYLGLLTAPAALPWLWAVLLGVSQAVFPLALTLIGLQGASTAAVARLSAFTQGVGYLVATPCPLIVGLLNDGSGGWTAPIVFMIMLLVPQIGFGVAAARRARGARADRG